MFEISFCNQMLDLQKLSLSSLKNNAQCNTSFLNQPHSTYTPLKTQKHISPQYN